MKIRCTCAFLILFTFSMEWATAQEGDKTQTKMEKLQSEKTTIREEEKAALKVKVQKIQERLDRGDISREEAQQLKRKAAKVHAGNIENRISIIENKMALLARGASLEEEDPWADSVTGTFEFPEDGEGQEHEDFRYGKRTQTAFVVTVGFNNAIQEGQSANDLDFKVAGSRFFELGLAWRTRVFQNSNWLRFKYGFSFQFNGLKPTDNRYFIQDGDLTVLREHPLDLDKSKFRMDNLVFPVHFELGPSQVKRRNDRVHFSTHRKFRIGLGGYAGFNLGKRQKLKYQEDGEKVKQKMKHDYNINEFVYGLSAYLGWGGTAAYVKYDLNPIFESPNQELRNISVGLRFDLD